MSRGSEETFFQRQTDGQQVNEKVLVISNHQGNANQTTIRYHLTPVIMTIIKKTIYSKCWQRCGEKRILVHCQWECKLVQPLWETVQENYHIIQQLHFWIFIQRKQKHLLKKLSVPALFTIAKTWKPPKCPVKDECVGYVYQQ